MLHFYVVTRPTCIAPGTVLALSQAQADLRRLGVERTASGFKVRRALCFKAGEVLGFERVPKALLPTLQALEEKKQQVIHASLQRLAIEQAGRLASDPLPAGLSPLEHVAWQTVVKEGHLTLKAYQKRCPGQSRRSLQRVLSSLVDKNLFVREGAPHQLIYCLAKGDNPCTL